MSEEVEPFLSDDALCSSRWPAATRSTACPPPASIEQAGFCAGVALEGKFVPDVLRFAIRWLVLSGVDRSQTDPCPPDRRPVVLQFTGRFLLRDKPIDLNINLTPTETVMLHGVIDIF